MKPKDIHTGLTAEILRMLILYDPATGDFYWRDPANGGKRGAKTGRTVGRERAGWLNQGRWKIQLPGYEYTFLASRLAWLWMTGEWPEQQVDHKSRDKSDDRWENLRAANYSNNRHNHGLRKNNTSGVAGVSWAKNVKMWHAECEIDGVLVLNTYYKLKSEAVEARRAVIKKHHGEFAVE